MFGSCFLIGKILGPILYKMVSQSIKKIPNRTESTSLTSLVEAAEVPSQVSGKKGKKGKKGRR